MVRKFVGIITSNQALRFTGWRLYHPESSFPPLFFISIFYLDVVLCYGGRRKVLHDQISSHPSWNTFRQTFNFSLHWVTKPWLRVIHVLLVWTYNAMPSCHVRRFKTFQGNNYNWHVYSWQFSTTEFTDARKFRRGNDIVLKRIPCLLLPLYLFAMTYLL